MKLGKKLVSFLLAFALMLGLMAVPVMAAPSRVDLGEPNMNFGNRAEWYFHQGQEGWVSDGFLDVEDEFGSALYEQIAYVYTGPIGISVADFQAARYLVVELNEAFPRAELADSEGSPANFWFLTSNSTEDWLGGMWRNVPLADVDISTNDYFIVVDLHSVVADVSMGWDPDHVHYASWVEEVVEGAPGFVIVALEAAWIGGRLEADGRWFDVSAAYLISPAADADDDDDHHECDDDCDHDDDGVVVRPIDTVATRVVDGVTVVRFRDVAVAYGMEGLLFWNAELRHVSVEKVGGFFIGEHGSFLENNWTYVPFDFALEFFE